VLSTFLTCTSFFNFYSLNPYLAAIFLFMNIPVMLLSKSTFTIIPSWMFTFSIPIFNYTSFNILNILLTSLCLPFSFAVLFEGSLYMLSGCIFLCVGHITLIFFFLCLGHLYHSASSSLLPLKTPCPLLFF